MIAIEQRVLIENYPKAVDERLLKNFCPKKGTDPLPQLLQEMAETFC